MPTDFLSLSLTVCQWGFTIHGIYFTAEQLGLMVMISLRVLILLIMNFILLCISLCWNRVKKTRGAAFQTASHSWMILTVRTNYATLSAKSCFKCKYLKIPPSVFWVSSEVLLPSTRKKEKLLNVLYLSSVCTRGGK